MKNKLTAVVASIVLANCAPEGEPISLEAAKSLSLNILHQRAASAPSDAGVLELQTVRAVEVDQLGKVHTRVSQTHQGVPVFGGEAIVHLESDGALQDITDSTKAHIEVDTTPSITSQEAIEIAVREAGGWSTLSSPPEADLQIVSPQGLAQLAWRIQLAAMNGDTPKKPIVFVDAHNGKLAWSYDNLKTARNRQVHNLNHSKILPGPLARSEGQAPTAEAIVDTNYDRLGSTYDCYKALFGRDSYDNAGASLVSSVHYGSKYVNAYWDGKQMVYGDGDNVASRNLAISMDVTAHELTHAVTERTSDLAYYGESGGLNEAMSDIFGATCEWYRDGAGNVTAPTSANTWLVGEEVWLAGQALRVMNDPAKDGISLDYYSSKAGNVDVHYSSGIANLAFYLLSNGGTHPRGKSTTAVAGIGIHSAARIFYRLNTVYLTPNSTFGSARVGAVKAAEDLFGVGSPEAISTDNAWVAVGVSPPLPPMAYTVIGTKTGINLARYATQQFSFPSNNVAAMNFQLSSGSYYSSDVYVKFGSAPTSTSYDCNWYYCEFNPAQSGTYYVLVAANWGDVTGAKLTTSAATEVCTDGLDNDGDGKIDCADADCRVNPACLPPQETSCIDGADNDMDGKRDCADSDCATSPACLPETQCADGRDSDYDTLIDCQDTDCAADAICTDTNWQTLSNASFEAGTGPYVLGLNATRVLNATYADASSYSVRIRNSGEASTLTTRTAMNLSTKSRMKIDFSSYLLGMEPGDNFIVEVLNGSVWEYLGRTIGTASNNKIHTTGTVYANLNTLSNKAAVKIRFRCDGSDTTDQVFLDNVKVSVK